MPVSKPSELPAGGDGRWPLSSVGFRSVQWGDMEVGFTAAGPIDCTPGYKGLPNDLCPCAHYGYVFKGKLRCVYPGSDKPDEVAEAGDVYFFEANHTLIYEEASEVLEINPAKPLQQVMDHFEGMAKALYPTAD
ncbi:hypothetical protein I6A84_10840 [Frankia sp. CNm7]|uniref:(S)-ureidoglycine aminohydrolase cupin domain-containing protein n=1 Tax=Frankia nepalensis TaxID=1836974 RepID=A0A937RVM1_9ACTN|nr:hypothetical protein [Frankia nepalensis]MBL7501158.1 hypothetical protein [Frankia nepalensis]MBL7512640.1 hypothetical protein [Frankia nepalensis]MBL7518593.1 hypothetical protein [Frankia nepalensis]MBL7632696.1 hypothetical protein [Frankia nepalensis]